MINVITKPEVSRFTDYLILGLKPECQKMTRELIERDFSIIEIYEQLFKESLYLIGKLWELNKISVASEHLATAVVEGMMNDLYPLIIMGKAINRKVVLGCIEHEQHQVGIKMVSDVFEKLGWETYFLGANVPNDSLMTFVDSINPDIVALSLSVYFNLPGLLKLITRLNQEHPKLQVIVGGQAFSYNSDLPEIVKNKVNYYGNLVLLEDGLSHFPTT